MVTAWENAMGAMAKRRETCHGSHGKKVAMAKGRLGKCHGSDGTHRKTKTIQP